VGEESVSVVRTEDQKLKQIPRRYKRKENVKISEERKCELQREDEMR
jgi:hypothetical protein